MALYKIVTDRLEKIRDTTFAEEKIKERTDLQRLLLDNIDVISGDLMVITEEFGEWEDSSRRIDILAIDRDACLAVIELKRTQDGGHMELQAIRYAAMVSTMTFDQVRKNHLFSNFEAIKESSYKTAEFLMAKACVEFKLMD